MARQAVLAYNPLRTMVLSRSSPVPLYFQLAQHIENEIRSGNLASGDRLENEVKIAEELGLSRPTVRAAFSYLVDKGLVLRRRGQGTVVTKGKKLIGQVDESVRRSCRSGEESHDQGHP